MTRRVIGLGVGTAVADRVFWLARVLTRGRL